MLNNLKPYPTMKDSGVPWLGIVPKHWEVRRQRTIVQMLVSNIDKITKQDELPVRLCNYVDVYKNERITERISFMQTSATRDEIGRFRLRKGDVIITKDSEDWNDIGVPAMVEYAAPDLLCGYHLAILRPNESILLGPYLLRALQSQGVAVQYHISANGVTRYGLSHNAIKNVLLPIPPLSEQSEIVRLLDHVDWLICKCIRVKQKLIALLNEQKQAIIHRAVTRGLDPNIPLKPSGVEWLGDIPMHWSIQRTKSLFRLRTEKSGERHGWELLSVYTHIGVRPRKELQQRGNKATTTDDYWIVRKNDIIVNKLLAWMGAIGISNYEGVTSPAYDILMPIRSLMPEFFHNLFRTNLYLQQFKKHSRGIMDMRLRLYFDQLGQIPLLIPSLEEQSSIVAFCTDATADLNHAIAAAQRQIALLREYRTRLIADVVTGKLDVRTAAANLPEEIAEPEAPEDIVVLSENEGNGSDVECDDIAQETDA